MWERKPKITPSTTGSPLLDKAKKGGFDLTDLGNLSESEINQKDKDGFTLLHYAAAYANRNACETLLKNHANPLLRNNSRWFFWGSKTAYDLVGQEGGKDVDKISIKGLITAAQTSLLELLPSKRPALEEFSDAKKALADLERINPGSTEQQVQVGNRRATMIKLSNPITLPSGRTADKVGLDDKWQFVSGHGPNHKTCTKDSADEKEVVRTLFEIILALRPKAAKMSDEIHSTKLGPTLAEKNPREKTGSKVWNDALPWTNSYRFQDPKLGDYHGAMLVVKLKNHQLIDRNGTKTAFIGIHKNGSLAYFDHEKKCFVEATHLSEQKKELAAILDQQRAEHQFKNHVGNRSQPAEDDQSGSYVAARAKPRTNPNNPEAPVSYKTVPAIKYEGYKLLRGCYPVDRARREGELSKTLSYIVINTRGEPEEFKNQCRCCGILSPTDEGGLDSGLTFKEFKETSQLNFARNEARFLRDNLDKDLTEVPDYISKYLENKILEVETINQKTSGVIQPTSAKQVARNNTKQKTK